MKKLFLAGLLSLGAIALSAPQSQAGQRTLCIDDSEFLLNYDGSTLCQGGADTISTDDNSFYLMTLHEEEASMVILQWPRVDISSVSVTELGSGFSYIETRHTSGINRTSGNFAVYVRYMDDVDRSIAAIEYMLEQRSFADLPGE